jgi:hypothetical protein
MLPLHHAAWLSVHPDRTEEWLADRLSDGFDIHHVDGDHGNNEPLNLVLMEAVDHMRMHGPRLRDGISSWRRNNGLRAKAARAHRLEQQRMAERHKPQPPLDRGDVAAYLTRAGRS